MIRSALQNQNWYGPEQLWLGFAAAIFLHGLLLGVNGLWPDSTASSSPSMLEALSDQATDTLPEEAKDGLVDRQASGNTLDAATIKKGLGEQGKDEQQSDLPLGANEQHAALAAEQGHAVMLQRSGPIKVYYSRSQDSFIGTATELQIAANKAAAGDLGQQDTSAVDAADKLLRIGAASKESLAVQYVEGWRRWMRANGNQFYPAEARRLGLRGDVLTQVRLNRDGSLANVRILKSSGQRLLDQAVIQTTREARWYLPFPAELAQRYDQLEFSWRWRYGAAQ